MKFSNAKSLIKEADFISEFKRIKDGILKLSHSIKKCEEDTGEIFTNLKLFEELSLEADKLVREKLTKNLKYVFVIGIGGSSLGTKAIYEALHKQYDILETARYPKIIFIESCDPEYLEKLDYFLESKIKDPDEILINIISKSGDTLETITNAEYVLHSLRRRFKKIDSRVVSTTEEESILWKFSRNKGIATLRIPENLSGRFSVFSPVGLFPLKLARIKTDELLMGAREANLKFLKNEGDSPTASAITAYLNLKNGKSIYDHFFFHSELESVGKWIRQLIGESLGKEADAEGKKIEANFTPTVSIGSTDLHSIAQLYLAGPKDKYFSIISTMEEDEVAHVPRDREFPEIYPEATRKTISQIVESILAAIEDSFANREIPYSEIILEASNEKELGEFMQFKMLEVYVLGKLLMGLDVFNQPNVQEYKDKTKINLVKMPGYAPKIPENWSNHAVVYQIYPRSFKDSNQDGIGDLNGVIEKLDYLNDGTENSLGIDAIWLNPIYKSPQKDFGYDVSDYYDIDPVFGDLEIFSKLTREASKRGIKIVMDFVPNHTSSEHPWFLESKSSRENPRRNWYIWKDPKPDGSPPNNWISVFGGSAWKLDTKTNQYYLYSFLEDQPDLNWRNPEVKEEMLNVLKFWIHHGVHGFRTDAIYHLIKDMKFRDDPKNPNYVTGDDPYNALLHTYSTGQPELLETTNSFCTVLGEHSNQFLVSEAYLDIKGMERLYSACGNKLHAPLNFNLMSLPWSAEAFKRFLNDFNHALSDDQVPNYVLGSHDVSRIMSKLGNKKSRLMAMLLFTLRGMAFVYYGEEIGMKDVNITFNDAKDPWNKVGLSGTGRDPERTPMQWNDSMNAGFSEASPWLPIADDYSEVNVSKLSKSRSSVLTLYKKLIHLKKKSNALKYGKYFPFEAHNFNIYAFTRESEKEKVLVALNFSGNSQKIMTSEIKKAKIEFNTFLDTESGREVELKNFELKPYEGYVFSF